MTLPRLPPPISELLSSAVFSPFRFLRNHIGDRPGRAGLTIALAGLALMAWTILKPASLFEWDEVLFAKALSSYDPASNSPHMPGYPLFVFLTRALSLLVHDPVTALQLWSFLTAVLSLLVFYRLTRRLELSRGQAALATIVFGTTPAFLWFSAVGLSDTSGLLLIGLTLYSVLAGESPAHALLSGALAACALGIRTQSLYFFPALVLIACFEWRAQRFRRMLQAGVACAVLSAFIWIPAMLLTGISRWWRAFVWQLGWFQYERAQGLALPHAPIRWIVEGWFLRPLGSPWLALLLSICVTTGAAILWKQGKRKLVCYSSCLAFSSLLISVFSLNLKNGPRYVLPSLFFLIPLVGGLVPEEGVTRKLLLLGPLMYVLGSVLWILPGIVLRHSRPAPVIEVLTEISEHYEPRNTRVYYDEKIKPHAEWILGRRGFQLFPLHELPQLRTPLQAGSDPIVSIAIYSKGGRVPAETIFEASWKGEQFRKLTMGRYLRCWACAVGPQLESDPP